MTQIQIDLIFTIADIILGSLIIVYFVIDSIFFPDPVTKESNFQIQMDSHCGC